MFETFLKLDKLQCKSNNYIIEVLLLMINNFEPNQIALYLQGGCMMHLATTGHLSHVMCHVSGVSGNFSTIPVWSGGITVAQARDVSRVQKRSVTAITGSWREDYTAACTRLEIEADHNSRHRKLCKTFAQKTATNSFHQDIFTKLDNPPNTRGGGKVWREPSCKTWRHLQSARPYLTRLLNGEDS